MYNIDLTPLVWIGAIIGVIVTLFVWGTITAISSYLDDGAIRSHTKIIPDIEVLTINGVSDTTYIYRVPVKD